MLIVFRFSKAEETIRERIIVGHAWNFVIKLSRLAGRQLFHTKDGRFGFTLRGVQPGDVVCVFNGAPVVHVLRKVSDDDTKPDRWRFVGDAYVHDLMDGEADEMDIEAREIVLV